jgi:aryl-alcohol dehydrogenase-like predicted oxidoreductase
VGPDAIALAAALAKPWADTVLSGAAGTHQLTSNLAALSVGEVDLPDLAEPPAEYWKHRSALAWA